MADQTLAADVLQEGEPALRRQAAEGQHPGSPAVAAGWPGPAEGLGGSEP